MSEPQSALTDYVSRLAQLSRDGEIVWSQVSPTIFRAARPTVSGEKEMTIQRADTPSKGHDFLFQVFQGGGKRPQLSIDTRRRPELHDSYCDLYEAARSSADKGIGRILKELVDAGARQRESDRGDQRNLTGETLTLGSAVVTFHSGGNGAAAEEDDHLENSSASDLDQPDIPAYVRNRSD